MIPGKNQSKKTSHLDNVSKTVNRPVLPVGIGTKPEAAFITVSISMPLFKRITAAVSHQKNVNRPSRPTFSKIVEQAINWEIVDELAGLKPEPKK